MSPRPKALNPSGNKKSHFLPILCLILGLFNGPSPTKKTENFQSPTYTTPASNKGGDRQASIVLIEARKL